MIYQTIQLENYVKTQNTKIAKSVENWLDKGLLGVVIDDNVFWFEVVRGFYLPEFVRKYAISFYKKQGYKYIGDIFQPKEEL